MVMGNVSIGVKKIPFHYYLLEQKSNATVECFVRLVSDNDTADMQIKPCIEYTV